ncbi:RNA polymerase sigma factor [Desulfosporosinus youngiae]|uniref:RNA polymerase sigma factor, sigma-70 family n=1 Tax=Desulfosporosinus youngiae DSM 17734 TaxID=768710 RepID=H5Y321_9FIRM|nr:sigma-70 family RNA polymerase sigma factor [Desulfosporosinus youngiae]EHQ88716.1 RNA polymerase sigma factor, sigma-70 family [Desulfosporosinus youngiae DSM 17734]
MSKDVLTNLYSKQASIIYSYLLKHGCRKEVAEEIVQDSFVKAIEHFHAVEPEKLSAWVFKVALNNYRNYLKKASVREELLIDETHFLKKIAKDNALEDILLLEEKATEIHDCLNSLKESYKELLILKYEMELSYKEIGKMLALPDQTVKTYLFRARTAFKRVWRDHHGR